MYDCHEEGDKIYVLMDWCKKGDLKKYVMSRTNQIVSDEECLHIIYQLLHALQYLHSRDVIHRDVKLENLLINEHNVIQLCDFGWLSLPGDRQRNVLCGTYEYMAPEIVRGIPYDHKVDIWATGVLAYELVHGKSPYIGSTKEETMYNICEVSCAWRQDLSPGLDKLIRQCLEYSPVYRPTASQLLSSPVFASIRKYYYSKASNTNPNNGGSVMNSNFTFYPVPNEQLNQPMLHPSQSKTQVLSQSRYNPVEYKFEEYHAQPNDNGKLPAELSHLQNYNPQSFEIDYTSRKEFTFKNASDYIDFDLNFGGAFDYLKEKTTGFFGLWKKSEAELPDMNPKPVQKPNPEPHLPVLPENKISNSSPSKPMMSKGPGFYPVMIKPHDGGIEDDEYIQPKPNSAFPSQAKVKNPPVVLNDIATDFHGKSYALKKDASNFDGSTMATLQFSNSTLPTAPQLQQPQQEKQPVAPPQPAESGFFSGVMSFFGFGGSSAPKQETIIPPSEQGKFERMTEDTTATHHPERLNPAFILPQNVIQTNRPPHYNYSIGSSTRGFSSPNDPAARS